MDVKDDKPHNQATPPMRDEKPNRLMGALLIALGIIGGAVFVIYFLSVLMEPAS